MNGEFDDNLENRQPGQFTSASHQNPMSSRKEKPIAPYSSNEIFMPRDEFLARMPNRFEVARQQVKHELLYQNDGLRNDILRQQAKLSEALDRIKMDSLATIMRKDFAQFELSKVAKSLRGSEELATMVHQWNYPSPSANKKFLHTATYIVGSQHVEIPRMDYAGFVERGMARPGFLGSRRTFAEAETMNYLPSASVKVGLNGQATQQYKPYLQRNELFGLSEKKEVPFEIRETPIEESEGGDKKQREMGKSQEAEEVIKENNEDGNQVEKDQNPSGPETESQKENRQEEDEDEDAVAEQRMKENFDNTVVSQYEDKGNSSPNEPLNHKPPLEEIPETRSKLVGKPKDSSSLSPSGKKGTEGGIESQVSQKGQTNSTFFRVKNGEEVFETKVDKYLRKSVNELSLDDRRFESSLDEIEQLINLYSH